MTIATSKLLDAASSLPDLLRSVVAEQPYRPAQWQRSGESYLPVTYEQFDARIRALACGLIRTGVKPGDRVAVLMENTPEWAMIDYAILSVGAVTVPMYCSYRPQDIAYVLKDSGARMVLGSGGGLLGHLLSAVDEVPAVKHIHVLDRGRSDDARLHALESLYAAPEQHPDEARELEKRLASVGRDTLATLVYTSGTTGTPKGVMLTHGNIMANLEVVPHVIRLRDDDMMLSFLPLAHALERTGGHFLPYSFGLSVAFAERPDTVAKNMAEARPTLLITVPRLLEVVRSRILGQVAKQSLISRSLFGRFLSLGGLRNRNALSAIGLMQFRLLDHLVGRRIRERFGGRLRLLISGGAPLSPEIALFFEAIGLPVLEGYGMTEAAPLVAVNPMRDRRVGSVGVPAHNTEVRIGEDGEILVRGPNVMQGYWKQKKESAAILQGGWLHTGDIGRMDDGYLYITDRKKDLIVNSGGENIAPQRIENLLVGDAMIDQVVVYGDQKPYLVALLVPNREACTAWAAEQGLPETDWSHLCASKVLRKMLQTRIAQILHPLNAYEQVRRIYLLDTPLSIDEGLLTPTMKVRRRQVLERYADIIEGLYS